MTRTPDSNSIGTDSPLACDACGVQALRSRRELQRFPYGRAGEQVELVAEVTVWWCGECGFEFTGGEAEEARHEAACQHLSILTPREILQLRARYQLSQAQLAELTGLHEVSIQRWELGLSLQDRSADHLLRAL